MEYAGTARSPESLGHILQQTRLLSRLTQREFANRLGTTQRHIWELETSKPSIAMLRLFTSLVDCNMTLAATIARMDDRNG
jgi:transcriptional regulator with XRE-family HTH domain